MKSGGGRGHRNIAPVPAGTPEPARPPSANNNPTGSTIIGLSGYARSGKDSLAAFLVSDHQFERIAFADALKSLVLVANPSIRSVVSAGGWEAAKTDPAIRQVLQDVGNEARNLLGEDVWVRAAFARMVPGGRYVITDVRYWNEAEAIQAAGGRLVRVTRPGVGPVNQHLSETALDDWPFTHTVHNSGSPDDLRPMAATLASLALRPK